MNPNNSSINKTPLKNNSNLAKNKVYIGNIPYGVTESGIIGICRNYGEIKDCQLKKQRNPLSATFAIVEYFYEEDAKNALENITGSTIGNNTLVAQPYRDPKAGYKKEFHSMTTLVVENMPESIDEGGMERIFSTYGPISQIKVSRRDDGTRTIFVNYSETNSANQAVQELQFYRPSENMNPLQIRYASNADFRQAAASRKNCKNCVHITNLPEKTDEIMMRNFLGKYGEIASVRIAFDKKFNCKTANVEFCNPQSAEIAAKGINNFVVGENMPKLIAHLVGESRPKNEGPSGVREHCIYHLRGMCFRGDRCWFSHEPKKTENNLYAHSFNNQRQEFDNYNHMNQYGGSQNIQGGNLEFFTRNK